MDYSQSHVVNNVEYLAVMCKRVMEKANVEVIRETHCKEREENKVRKSTNYFTTDEWASQRATTRSAKVNFEYNQCTIVIKEVR